MQTQMVFTVGNSMMGDDGAGPLLAKKMTENSIANWQVIDGGSSPENVVHIIRRIKPNLLLIIDATEMGLNPGEIRFVDVDMIAEMFLMNTHNMPLNFLVEQLKPDIESILFLGIQPDIVGFYYPMTNAVIEAVEKVYQALQQNNITTSFERLQISDNGQIA
ncbi:hydrogenase maturation peptidase HycI [Orbus sturtevantii]|uniref:hydrogenase maturation peptidase HycI n=1 Tax=Orbus sturtevantii TaxID=3074109 RepID=UPI00370D76A2